MTTSAKRLALAVVMVFAGATSVAAQMVTPPAFGAPTPVVTATDRVVIGPSGAQAILMADAANTLAQRNGTNAQTFRVYNTYTDASNYERMHIGWTSNSFRLLTENAGTGTNRNLILGTNGGGSVVLVSNNTDRWYVSAGGHFIAATDNTYDIGASGATRPRNGYFGSGLFAQSFTASGVVVVAKTAASQIRIPGDGLVQFTNDAATGLNRLILGTNDANGVALGKSGTTIQFLLGDGSNYALTQGSEYKAFGTTHFNSNSTTGTLVTNDPQTVANAGVISLGNNTNINKLVVSNVEDAALCEFTLLGGNAPAEVIDTAGLCSVTAGTASSINVYWSAGNARYELQNNRAATRTLHLVKYGKG